MEELILQFRDYLISELNYSINTIDAYLRDLKQFIYTQNIDNVLEIDDISIKDFFNYLAKNKLKNVTIARKSSSILHFQKFLCREGFINNLPKKNLSITFVKQKIPQVLSHEKILEIINYYDSKNDFESWRKSLIISVLYTTGIRVSELVYIKIKDFIFDDNNMVYFVRIMGKGKRERIIPVHDLAMKIVQKGENFDQISQNIWLFEKFKKNLTRQRIAQILWDIEDDFGIKINPHILRHSFATYFLHKTQNIRMVQKLLGHVNLSSTQIYTHINKQELKANVFKKHPLQS